jgi:predicted GNAT family acetyltransferase
MFIKQEETAKKEILAYASQEPEINLFILGDIESIGVNKKPVSIFLNKKSDGTIDSLLLKYGLNRVVYSDHDDFDVKSLVEFLKADKRMGAISGKSSIVRQIAPYFPARKLEPTTMTALKKKDIPPQSLPAGFSFKLLKAGEMIHQRAILELSISDFGPYKGETKEEKLFNLEQGFKVSKDETLVIIKDEEMIAMASLTASFSLAAMVVGVCVKEEYRHLGLGRAMVNELCRLAFASGKEFLCLFYDNPIAWKIYGGLGFAPIGAYDMLKEM